METENNLTKTIPNDYYVIKTNRLASLCVLLLYFSLIIFLLYVLFDTYINNNQHGYIYTNPIAHFKALFIIPIVLALYPFIVKTNVTYLIKGWNFRINGTILDIVYKGKLYKNIPISEIDYIVREKPLIKDNYGIYKIIKPSWFRFRIYMKTPDIMGTKSLPFYVYCKNHSPDIVQEKLSEYFGEIKTVIVDDVK